MKMKQYFLRAMDWLRRFMAGRYGPDELTTAVVISGCVFTFLSNFRPLRFMYFIGMLVMAVAVWRTLSKNIDARYRERMWFLRVIEKPKAEFKLLSNIIRDRKTHKYFKCKNCGSSLRVPRGKGNISVTCPRCRVKTQKKT